MSLNKLTVKTAAYARDPRNGEPILELDFEETAEFAAVRSQKKSLTDLGYLFLGAEFERIVKPLMLPADPDDGRIATELRGFTRDETALTLYHRFLEDQHHDRFQIGPISII